LTSTILVTGGAGYIGSHMILGLIDRGDRVVVIDNLSTGVREQVCSDAEFVEGDVADTELVRDILKRRKVDAVIHFAGSVIVPESVTDPLKYYDNNTAASRNLLAACIAEGVGRFVFSSTAAVYGMPDTTIVTEETPTAPINPYGRSKLMTEWMLRDIAAAHPFRFMALRYFNVAGADPAGRTGQSTPRATHLIKRACQAALGRVPALDIFGTDFDTPDGTGVRDYIHVSDLIAAHLLALDALASGAESNVYNCGYGRGLSVREIIAAMERVSGVKVPAREGPRRAGDPGMLVADSSKLTRQLGWTPRHGDIDEIVKSAFAWEKHLA
jgi:UDP-glucose 4-epimerase